MSGLRIERHFEFSPTTVFAFVTKPENLLLWWGHEGMTITSHQLDFSQIGPWHSALLGAEGNAIKMSGEVLAVDPPNSVEFSWGWHDAKTDVRGGNSTVRFEMSADGKGGTHFVLNHIGLPDEQSERNHGQGWSSVLARLERLVNGA